MIEVRQTEVFRVWLRRLKDARAAARIAQWIARVQAGLLGDAKSVGGGVSELRVDYGPGYPIFFVRRGNVLVILLCGGDQGSQKRDIARAQAMTKELEADDEDGTI